MLDTPPAKVRRAVAAMVAVAALTTACTSHHGNATRSGSTTTAAARALDKEIVDHPCSVVDRKDLARVTGLTFDAGVPAPDVCAYMSGDIASIPLRFAALGPVSPTLAVSTSTATCDAGSVTLVHFTGGDEGFVCTVQAVATVGATGSGVYALLQFGALAADTPPLPTLKALATTVHDALARG